MPGSVEVISIIRGEEGYRPDARKFEAFVDGSRVGHLIRANAAEGWAECHVRAAGGGPEADEEGTLKVLRRKGKVLIRKPGGMV